MPASRNPNDVRNEYLSRDEAEVRFPIALVYFDAQASPLFESSPVMFFVRTHETPTQLLRARSRLRNLLTTWRPLDDGGVWTRRSRSWRTWSAKELWRVVRAARDARAHTVKLPVLGHLTPGDVELPVYATPRGHATLDSNLAETNARGEVKPKIGTCVGFDNATATIEVAFGRMARG